MSEPTKEKVAPASELKHIDHPSCWCQPEIAYKDPVNGAEVWVHKETKQ